MKDRLSHSARCGPEPSTFSGPAAEAGSSRRPLFNVMLSQNTAGCPPTSNQEKVICCQNILPCGQAAIVLHATSGSTVVKLKLTFHTVSTVLATICSPKMLGYQMMCLAFNNADRQLKKCQLYPWAKAANFNSQDKQTRKWVTLEIRIHQENKELSCYQKYSQISEQCIMT